MIEKKQQESESNEALMLKMEGFTQSILAKRDAAISHRSSSGVERRWREDLAAYDGFDPVLSGGPPSMLDYATGEAYQRSTRGPKRSEVVVNVIRPKVETAIGRFCDILMPVDGKNWSLSVTPVPDLMDGLKDDTPAKEAVEGFPQDLQSQDGTEPKVSDIAKSQLEGAKARMKLMEMEIDDQLSEGRYNGECREVICDAAILGTGVLKGPCVIKSVQKSWQRKADETGEVYTVERSEQMTPASRRVNPQNVYPDPDCGGDRNKMTYIWEYDEVTPRELRNLMGVDGYIKSQIVKVLQQEPQRTRAVQSSSGTHVSKTKTPQGSTFERWEYHGDVSTEDLKLLGCDCDEQGKTVSACIVFVNDTPIKAALSALETGELPYDFFQWSKLSDSIWGVGIPRQMLWQQRIIIGAWRAMMDNAGDSSGANVIINRKLLEPADNVYELTGKKIWYANGVDVDINKAFAQFQVANNQDALQKIIELALRFTDIETAVPMVFQGEKQDIPDTLGATNILMDSNNVALRSRVKLWDDSVTVPHLSRYYDWNMQYNENQGIKGDYNVIPLGVSTLLSKDQQAQDIAQLFQLRQDPIVNIMVDWKKAIKELFSAKRLDVLNSDDVITQKEQEPQQHQPQQDPQKEIAKIRHQRDKEKAKLVQASDMAEIQFKAEEAERQRQHEREMKSIDFQIKQMEFAERRGISLDQIKADLAAASEKLNVQVALAKDKMATGPEIMKPPVEPEGRAPEGRSFPE